MGDPFAARLRAAAAACLPPGAFLRRDRGAALYVTDAPRFEGGWQARLERAGFQCRVEGMRAALTPGPRWMAALEAAFPEPPDYLCASLLRFRGLPPADESLGLFAEGLRALDGGDGGECFERRLRQCAARCLRDGGGGGLYACALVSNLLREERTT